MAASAWQGAVVAGYGSPENSDAGSVFSSMGFALMDSRLPYTYQPGGAGGATGFLLNAGITVIDAVPSAIGAANIAAAQVPAAGTALVLTAGAGVTAVNAANSGTGTQSTALALDGVPTPVQQNANNSFGVWNPATMLARNVRVTSVGNDSGATFLVSGLDVFGFPMSELITGANAGVAAGRKAFKYIVSVTPAGTLSGSNVSVGTGDVYGFPLRADSSFYATIYWNGAQVTSPTGFTAADQTNPATSTTGDVRGTYAVQSASDGTKRLMVIIAPSVPNIASAAGLYGVTQS